MTRATMICLVLFLLLAPKGATSAERHSLRASLEREIGDVVRGFDDEAVVDVELTPARPKEMVQLPGTSIVVDSTMVAQDDTPEYRAARVTVRTRLGKLSEDAENLIRRKAAFLATDVKIFYGLPIPGFKTPERRLNNEQIKAESKNSAALRSAVTAAIERAPMFTELDLPGANNTGLVANPELSAGATAGTAYPLAIVTSNGKNAAITQPAQVSLVIQPAPIKAAGGKVATMTPEAVTPTVGGGEFASELERLGASVSDVVRLAMIGLIGGGILLLLISIERSWQSRRQLQTLNGGLRQVIQAIAEKSDAKIPDLFSDLENFPQFDGGPKSAASTTTNGSNFLSSLSAAYGTDRSSSESSGASLLRDSAEWSTIALQHKKQAVESSANVAATGSDSLANLSSDENPASYARSIRQDVEPRMAGGAAEDKAGSVSATFAAYGVTSRLMLETFPDDGLSALFNDCYWSESDGQAAYLWRRLSAKQRNMLTTRFPRMRDYVIYLNTVTEQLHEFEKDPYYLAPLPIDHLDGGALTLAVKSNPPLYARISAIRASMLKLNLNERLEFAERAADGLSEVEIEQLRSIAPSLPRNLAKLEPTRLQGVDDETRLIARVGEFDLSAMRQMPSLVWSERLSDDLIREILKSFNVTDLASAWVGPESVLIRLHGLLPERKAKVLDSYLSSIKPSRESEAFSNLFARLLQAIEDEAGGHAVA